MQKGFKKILSLWLLLATISVFSFTKSLNAFTPVSHLLTSHTAHIHVSTILARNVKDNYRLIQQNELFEQILMSSGRYSNESDDDDIDDAAVAKGPAATNVLGTTLCPCCTNVGNSGIGTGFYRNGYCATGEQDLGRHTVCVQVTNEFLAFSKAVGNDLSTPVPQYLFPGLKDGNIWCLCAERWVQAYEAGMAPKIFLKSTHEKTLDFVSYDILRQYANDQSEADDTLNLLNEQRNRLNKLL
jgi:uncharacterized protein